MNVELVLFSTVVGFVGYHVGRMVVGVIRELRYRPKCSDDLMAFLNAEMPSRSASNSPPDALQSPHSG